MKYNRMNKAVLCCVAFLFLGFPNFVFGDEKAGEDDGTRPGFELEEMIVTGSSQGKSLESIPQNVTVITSWDIENSTAGNVVDLLGREAGINIRSVTGNEGRSGIDIRGMGDTYVSNVIIMVDGFRLNASDMSGADFLSVPLGQVERIEIIRGSGGVRYGNGAVGGVVNILTKKPDKDGMSGKIAVKAASYESYGTRFSMGIKKDRVSFLAGAGYKDSDGYRENGGVRKKDASAVVGIDFTDNISMGVNLSLLESKMGFPGPVSKADASSEEDRRKTDSPNDFSETTDHKITGKLEVNSILGLSTFKAGYRDRDNGYIIGYSPLATEADQTDIIVEDTLHFSFDHEYGAVLAGHENTLGLGMEFYNTGYMREDAKNLRKNGDTRTIEGFVHDEFELHSGLKLSGGLRYSRFKGDFRDDKYEDFYGPKPFPHLPIPGPYLYSAWVDGQTTRKIWNNHAYELGLVWDALYFASLFVSHSKSYRIPNVDELALADDDLHPQTSRHYDTGIRFKLGSRAEFSLAVFDITTSDEIYYGEDPANHTTINRNYDEKTRRRGLETEFRAYPADWLYVWGNYSYTRAKFEARDTFIPLVPEHMGNAGVEVTVHPSLTIALNASFSGPKFDGNDQDNVRDDNVLGSYQVFDGKITWKRKDFRVYGGIKNMFNEFYATSGYSGSVYPMAARSFFCGMDWQF